MKRIWISIALVGTLLIGGSCNEKTKTPTLTKEVTFTKEGELRVIHAKNDSVVARLDIEIADNGYETETGLMYRKSMLFNQAMLFIFDTEQRRAFYMKNTEFPLDIIYLTEEKEIESIQKNAKPFDKTSLPSIGSVRYVLEVNAGLSDQWNLQNGDRVEWKAMSKQ